MRNEVFRCKRCGILVAPDPGAGRAVESHTGIDLSKEPVPKHMMLLISSPLLIFIIGSIARNPLSHDVWEQSSYAFLTFAAINVAWYYTHNWGTSLLRIINNLHSFDPSASPNDKQ